MPNERRLLRAAVGGPPSYPGYGGYAGGSRLIDLIMFGGQQQAEAAREQGQLWGETISGVGQQIGAGLQQHAQQKAIAKRDAALAAAVESWDGKDPKELYGRLNMLDPKARLEMINGIVSLRSLGEKAEEKDKANFQTVLQTAAKLPYPVFERWYPAMRGKMAPGAERFLGIPQDQIPPEPSQELHQTLQQLAGNKPPQADEYTLGPGQARFRGGQQIAAVPAAPEKGPAVGSFEDYVVRTYGEKPTPEQIVQARKAYGQADDRQRIMMPIVVQTAEGPQIVDRSSGQARAITGAGGAPLGAMPTTEQRNRIAATERAQPVLDSVAELSERINTLQGVVAKASGAVEKEKAKLNLSDDVAEYQALVSGFTPMLARMVGHTGVLTEQDVQSVRAMLPQPGDSKSVRDRKVARVKKILSGQGGSPAGQVGTIGRFKVEVE